MTRTRRRAGFTLVEMLVVMGMIVVLATIAVAVSESGAFGSGRVVGGADRVSGWLLIAKQRALRDARPRGVRFLLADDPARPLTANPNDYRNFSFVSREAQYIELPDAWAPNPAADPTGPQLVLSVQTATGPTPPAGTLVPRVFLTTNRTNSGQNLADVAEIEQRVGTGDLLVYSGASYRIRGIASPPSATPPFLRVGTTDYPGGPNDLQVRELVLEVYPDLGAASSGTVSAPPQGTIVTSRFAIQAQPRPLVGEPLLQLTGSSAIDVRSKTFVNPIMPTSPPGPYAPQYGVTAGGPAWPPTSLGVRLTGSASPVECMAPVSPPTGVTPGALPQYFDILFAPSGQVLNTDAGVVALWIRDPDKTPHPRLKDQAQFATNPGLDDLAVFDEAGEQVLVVVSPRTGMIATQPVTRGQDPHAAAKDGINSGL